ncbi:MAG: glycosyltransferase family 1 protein [Chloroflexi bacterium]|nr:glycosyltransferase family 1 protein [Chloroflexota bacterium]
MNRQPLNIALIVNLYPPYIVGGNEILARDVTEALRARGHRVHILTGYGQNLPRDGFSHGVLDLDLDRKQDYFLGNLPLTAERMFKWHLYSPRSYQGVYQTLDQIRPDAVIAWNLYSASMSPLVAARRSGPWPVIAHPADKWLLYSLKNLGDLVPAKRRWHAWGLKIIKNFIQPPLNHFARPDYILAVSEFIRGLHIRAGFPAAQSKATYLGVPVTQFPTRVPEYPRGRPWRLIFAGQLWAGKGPQVAIEAIHLLRFLPELPAITLDIYGSGAESFVAYLQGLIRERQIGDRVHLNGFISRQQLAQEFQRHDAFLFCSIWDEPFSGGLLEALSAGLPTIATTAGGTPEAIHDLQTGLLVAPNQPQVLADAIVRLMHDPELYCRLGHQGAQEVRQRWSFDRYIDRLEEIYYAIVENHRPNRPIILTAPVLTADS